MAVAASGILSVPLDAMRTLIAATSAFQTWVGVETAAAAKAFIHLIALNEAASLSQAEREALRPVAVIGFGDDFHAAEDAEPGPYMRHGGQIEVVFEAVITAAYTDDEADAVLEFANSVGAVVEEMESTSRGTGTYLHLVGYHKTAGPGRYSPEDIAAGELDIYQMSFLFDWDEC